MKRKNFGKIGIVIVVITAVLFNIFKDYLIIVSERILIEG